MPGRADDDWPEGAAELYDRLGAALYRYALAILVDPPAAEDVVQDVFMAVVRRGVAGVDATDAYLRRAVRNACFDRLRRRRDEAAGGSEDGWLERAAATGPDMPNERIAIGRALSRLPADQREVVHLKVFEGRTFQEIADLSDTSINTIASRYRYAMEKLRAALSPRGEK